MIGIPYINSLFQSIIDVSLVLRGNFFLCPKFASELNSASLAEIVLSVAGKPKYPAALLLPPRVTGNFQYSGEEVAGTQIGYNMYTMQMLFIRPTSYTAHNQPSQPVPIMQVPTHTAPDSWHDMQRCAESFLQVLRQVLMQNNIYQLAISDSIPQSMTMVTDIGNDKVSGVLFTFGLMVNGGCDIEDYPENYLQQIAIPEIVDTHPTHINT